MKRITRKKARLNEIRAEKIKTKKTLKNLQSELCFLEKLAVVITGFALICDLIFPKLALAEKPITFVEKPEDTCISIPREFYCYIEDGSMIEYPSLPFAKDVPRQTFWVYVTAYSSTPDQTDSSPFVTAMGSIVRDGIVATNILPFKTRIKFPDEFGEKEFIVEDRMNKRFNDKRRADIWMPTREKAINFGAKWLEVEVY